MRRQLDKLTKKHSTKSERRFMELLKQLHIPFRAKVIIKNKEVDFLIGRYAIDIDGHPQSSSRNAEIIKDGYVPVHLTNKDVSNTNQIKQWLVLTFSVQ